MACARGIIAIIVADRVRRRQLELPLHHQARVLKHDAAGTRRADYGRVRNLIATAVFAVALSGCTLDEPDQIGEPTIDSRVSVLPEVTGMVVDATTVTIPRAGNESLTALEAGDIIVSTQGEGFLRRIDQITLTLESIVLTTSEADLGDAMIDGQVATSVGGEGKADTYQLPPIGFTISNRMLLDNAAITAKLVKGTLVLAPEIDLDLSISDRSVQNFEMVVRGRIRGELDIEIDAREAEVGPEIILYQGPSSVFYQQVGILPLVETVSTSVVLKLQATAKGAGRIRITADALATMAAGLRYSAAAGWDGIADASLTTHGSIPESSVTFEQLGVRAWLAARVDVRLYGVVGPFVMVGPQASAWRNTSDGHIGGEIGLRGAAGGGLKFLRFNVPASPTYDLFDVTRPLL
jgi:hypothetical protein